MRSMRKWWYPTTGPFGNEPVAPPGINTIGGNQLDTTRPGHTLATDPNSPGSRAVWFDDQSDDIPQYISPINQSNVCCEASVFRSDPSLLHPLLQGPNGAILAFADHMHEGEVILPSNTIGPLPSRGSNLKNTRKVPPATPSIRRLSHGRGQMARPTSSPLMIGTLIPATMASLLIAFLAQSVPMMVRLLAWAA